MKYVSRLFFTFSICALIIKLTVQVGSPKKEDLPEEAWPIIDPWTLEHNRFIFPPNPNPPARPMSREDEERFIDPRVLHMPRTGGPVMRNQQHIVYHQQHNQYPYRQQAPRSRPPLQEPARLQLRPGAYFNLSTPSEESSQSTKYSGIGSGCFNFLGNRRRGESSSRRRRQSSPDESSGSNKIQDE